jgi:glycosyltransferase involved in cell wall biosynthesis
VGSPVKPVLLLGHGLSRELSGIERLLVEHAGFWNDSGRPVRVAVDPEASWPTGLAAGIEVVAVPRRSAQLLRQVPSAVYREAVLVHSFGPVLPSVDVPTVYSVYDWGPLRDRSMSPRARLVWSAAMARGINRATVVHTISEQTRLTAPRWALRGKEWRVTAPAGLRPSGPNLPREGFLLHVGAAVARKRLAQLVAAVVSSSDLELVLVGSGSEAYAEVSPRVRALGAVSDEELVDWYARCGALALLSTYEGFGIPVREALQRGVPVVVSPAVLACHPDADLSLVVVSEEPQLPGTVAEALRRALALPAGPRAMSTGPGPASLYAGLL